MIALSVAERVRRVIAKFFGVDLSEVTPEFKIFSDDLDSLEVVEAVNELQLEFEEVSIKMDDIGELVTVAKAIKFIENLADAA